MGKPKRLWQPFLIARLLDRLNPDKHGETGELMGQ